MVGDKLVRIGKELLDKLEVIRQVEEERGNVDISYKTAGEILSKRIDLAGGIKQNIQGREKLWAKRKEERKGNSL